MRHLLPLPYRRPGAWTSRAILLSCFVPITHSVPTRRIRASWHYARCLRIALDPVVCMLDRNARSTCPRDNMPRPRWVDARASYLPLVRSPLLRGRTRCPRVSSPLRAKADLHVPEPMSHPPRAGQRPATGEPASFCWAAAHPPRQWTTASWMSELLALCVLRQPSHARRSCVAWTPRLAAAIALVSARMCARPRWPGSGRRAERMLRARCG